MEIPAVIVFFFFFFFFNHKARPYSTINTELFCCQQNFNIYMTIIVSMRW